MAWGKLTLILAVDAFALACGDEAFEERGSSSEETSSDEAAQSETADDQTDDEACNQEGVDYSTRESAEAAYARLRDCTEQRPPGEPVILDYAMP